MQQQNATTLDVCTSLFWHLSGKGLVPSEVHRRIKDIFCILQDGGTVTVGFVNHQRSDMGWTAHLIDKDTIELVLTILETEFEDSVSAHTVH